MHPEPGQQWRNKKRQTEYFIQFLTIDQENVHVGRQRVVYTEMEHFSTGEGNLYDRPLEEFLEKFEFVKWI
jgi:hypothetical protein